MISDETIDPVLRPYMQCLVILEGKMAALRDSGKRLRSIHSELKSYLDVAACSSDNGAFERDMAAYIASGYNVTSALQSRRQAIESGKLRKAVNRWRTEEILQTGKLKELEALY